MLRETPSRSAGGLFQTGVMTIVVPPALAANHVKQDGEAGRAWSAGLPALAERYLREWELRLDGEPRHGVVSLVLPVVRADGTPAALKLQPVTDEHATEGPGLRAWAGNASVLLLDEDPAPVPCCWSGWTRPGRCPRCPTTWRRCEILAGLLARLVAVPAPPGMPRRLGDIAQGMLDDVPEALAALGDERERHWLRVCAGAVGELVAEPGDRLLHWDLHYDNVLAGEREPWLSHRPQAAGRRPGVRPPAGAGQPVGRRGRHR